MVFMYNLYKVLYSSFDTCHRFKIPPVTIESSSGRSRIMQSFDRRVEAKSRSSETTNQSFNFLKKTSVLPAPLLFSSSENRQSFINKEHPLFSIHISSSLQYSHAI
mmetsp:Transcript_3405/g.5139  ORF Transcript_3405/g.5139 Transcript_3405/m.5139 type:complete len:106 (-) Transcript_3405:2217-2534(-)